MTSNEPKERGMDGPAILIIGGRTEALLKASALGVRTVLMQHKDRLLPGQVEAADATLLVDFTDWRLAVPLARAAQEAYGFTRVMSLTEPALETVGRINDALGLEGTSYEVAHRFRDKLLMRRRLAEAGLPDLAAAPVESAGDLTDFGRTHGYPLILKPVDGVGSRGVTRIDSEEEVAGAWSRAEGLRGRTDLQQAAFHPVDRYMVERYAEGPEFSVEAVSAKGAHTVVAVTEKLTEGSVERGHAQPPRIPAAQEAALVAHVQEFLTAMGLRDGLSHTEVRLTPEGPRVIEGHDRVGGGRIMDLTRHVHGVDLEEYAVGAPLGLLPPLPDAPAPRGAAATRFLTAEPGEVVEVEGLEAVRAHPGLIDVDPGVRPGDLVRPVTENFDRIGQLLAGAESTDAAVELCEELVGRVVIHTRTPQPAD
ncbi:ATP-grasp domain-containing protein [Streptomyces sp. NPDC056503]|uniref:ATP-grasp domain-containing protein n=1 Tax=Streptomyces sp. NPDC056503 TaxID=3345842 RepID=UPI0036B47F22